MNKTQRQKSVRTSVMTAIGSFEELPRMVGPITIARLSTFILFTFF